jgi:hypothetical protein
MRVGLSADSKNSVLSPTSAADKSASAQMASQRQPIAGARWFASYYCEYLLPVLSKRKRVSLFAFRQVMAMAPCILCALTVRVRVCALLCICCAALRCAATVQCVCIRSPNAVVLFHPHARMR